MSRLCKSGAGPVSCPAAGQDCDCPSCIVSLVVNNQLIFFRSENISYSLKIFCQRRAHLVQEVLGPCTQEVGRGAQVSFTWRSVS